MISESVLYIAPKDITDTDRAGKKMLPPNSLMYPQKEHFDTLSYKDRLDFWITNKGLQDCWLYEIKKGKTEKVFSIIPSNDTERELFINWRIQLIKDMFKNTPHHEDWLKRWDYDEIVKDYYLKKANHETESQTIGYCKARIKTHNNQLGTETPAHLFLTSPIKIGADSFRNEIKLHSVSQIFDCTYFDFEGLLTGENCARLIYFYEQQIITLEQNSTVPFTGNAIFQLTERKTETLKAKLGERGFFNLPTVKPLTIENTEKLLELINSNNLPYRIAMIYFLGFIKHTETEYFSTKRELFKNLADVLGSNERTVKGNINVLSSYSTEDKERYTAHLHKGQVEKDYQKLK